MALPFGICDASEAFNMAQDFEEEQEEQNYEEERSCHDEFILRLSPNFRQASVDSRDEKKPWLTVSKLIITTNDVGAAFTDAYLLNQDAALKMGLVSGPYTSCRKGNTVNQTSFWDKSCFLYSFRDQPDVILCQMKQTIDEKFVFDWAEKVLSLISPKSVIVFTTMPKSNLQLDEARNGGFDTLYQLKSDSYESKSNIPALPIPNLVRELPAAVLTHCQVHSVASILYILATETLHFDVTAVKSFAPVLKEDIFKDIHKNSEEKVKEALKRLCNMDIPDKGVYI